MSKTNEQPSVSPLASPSCSMFSEDWWERVFDGRGSFAGDFNRSKLVFSETEVRAILVEEIGRLNLSSNSDVIGSSPSEDS